MLVLVLVLQKLQEQTTT